MFYFSEKYERTCYLNISSLDIFCFYRKGGSKSVIISLSQTSFLALLHERLYT